MAKFTKCYKCPDRCADPNCHDTCKRHQEEKAELAKANAERRKDIDFTAAKVHAADYTARSIRSGHLRVRKKNERI